MLKNMQSRLEFSGLEGCWRAKQQADLQENSQEQVKALEKSGFFSLISSVALWMVSKCTQTLNTTELLLNWQEKYSEGTFNNPFPFLTAKMMYSLGRIKIIKYIFTVLACTSEHNTNFFLKRVGGSRRLAFPSNIEYRLESLLFSLRSAIN